MGFSKITFIVLLLGLAVLLGWLTYILVGFVLWFLLWWGIRIGADVYYFIVDRR